MCAWRGGILDVRIVLGYIRCVMHKGVDQWVGCGSVGCLTLIFPRRIRAQQRRLSSISRIRKKTPWRATNLIGE